VAAGSRKYELPWLNVAFCAMVLWSHCSAHPITNLDRSSWQFLFVYLAQRLSFVSVYGFFLLSGVKLTLPRSKPSPLLPYWRGRMQSIFLPYLLAVLVYYLWFVYFLRYFPFSWSALAGYAVRGDLSSHFYFVIALFQFVLLTPLFRWLSERWSPLLLLPMTLGLSWLSAQHLPQMLQLIWPDLSFRYADRVFLTYAFYYLAGCYIGRRYEDFLALLKKDRALILASFALFAGADLVLTALQVTGRRAIPYLEQIHMLYILSAILFCFWAATCLPREMPRWLIRVDQASYLIYLYHCLVISAFNDKAAQLGIDRVGTQFVLRLLVVYTATPLLCVLWQHGVSRPLRAALQQGAAALPIPSLSRFFAPKT
jgi:surface polysaccharide O-acyltransferase-like enzyme